MSKHLPLLDGLRGVAVLLVIASHAFPMLPELPWTVKRFSNLGFYGVQLFFVVSAITLANSWRRSETRGRPSLQAFALRRIFRIAPAYFLAAASYLWLSLPPSIAPAQLLALLTFTNGWTPSLMPTTPDTWAGVPGGWSVEAEFGFYAMFPVIVTALRGIPRAIAGLLLSLVMALVMNAGGLSAYEPAYGHTATDQFLYYWLPNQLPVFLTASSPTRSLPSAPPVAASGPPAAALPQLPRQWFSFAYWPSWPWPSCPGRVCPGSTISSCPRT